MFRKIQKPMSVFTISILLFLIVLSTCTTFLQIHTAQAQTFEQHIPTFGLYCKDETIIQSGTVKYDLSDAETIAQGKSSIQSSYQIAAVNRTVEFVIPFISSAENAPLFLLKQMSKKSTAQFGTETPSFRPMKIQTLKALLTIHIQPILMKP